MNSSSQCNIDTVVGDILDKSTHNGAWRQIFIRCDPLVFHVLGAQRNVDFFIGVVHFQHRGSTNVVGGENVVKLVSVIVQSVSDERDTRNLFAQFNNHIALSGFQNSSRNHGAHFQVLQ
ncbi:hypothetical protein OGATHE_000565 [Ogataea polymorpha]|uniref:Uncharacterized protein n=1 Tax=Ogataea polymorpha TaxID=460523 RepID=A0A9P8TGE8_9ASCO|nr:hypothetical protein OGATHE_000565 [Ogataea polymorpha]